MKIKTSVRCIPDVSPVYSCMIAHSPTVIRAHAKINLGLLVTGKRSDGYHDIATVFHRIALADRITLSPAAGITVHSTGNSAPSGETNICHQAARLVAEELGERRGVLVDIVKTIPVGAGLGGGSSDAAAVLRALPRFWEAEIHRLQGILVLRQPGTPQAEVEAWLQRALDIARRQEAKALELRAAMSLGRLWQQQGKRQAAYDLLAPLYHWFTEGFDTADLQDARALLAELSH